MAPKEGLIGEAKGTIGTTATDAVHVGAAEAEEMTTRDGAFAGPLRPGSHTGVSCPLCTDGKFLVFWLARFLIPNRHIYAEIVEKSYVARESTEETACSVAESYM